MEKLFAEEVEEIVKKSNLQIKNSKDIEKISQPSIQFLDCIIKEDKEDMLFYYNVLNKKTLSQLRREKKINQLRALIEVAKLSEIFRNIKFTLNPENLYFDRNFRIYVKFRDVYEQGMNGEDKEFLEQYKALIGHVIQNKYSFEDYYKGGNDLYKKNVLLKKISESSQLNELINLLENEFEETENLFFNKKVEVNKSWYQLNKWCLVIAVGLITVSSVYITYLCASVLPRKNAMIQASNEYLSGSYINVIDNLKQVDLKYLDKYQKFILAVSYVKSESLSSEQKETILTSLSIDGEEKIKDYWIYLGRLDTVEAENIAMQRSDDELLLYAYMTEKAILEKNTKITGEEKAERIKNIEQKISELAKQYESTDEIEDNDILLGE